MTAIASNDINHTRDTGRMLERRFGMLIDGQVVDARSGATFETHSPSTGQKLATVPFAQRDDVDRAVAAAKRAFLAWRETTVLERIERVRAVIAILKANVDELATLDSVDGGNPRREMIKDVHNAAAWLDYQANAAMEVKGYTLPSLTKSWLINKREPYGVIGRIGAYNHPLMFTAGKIGAPLVMGNCIVIKIPEQAPLSSLRFGELIREVFPPGVVSIISGDGPSTGDALVRHPDVKRLALIGSVPTGMRIQQSAAEVCVKHVTLELGGKNPMIVFPDADLERAVEFAALGTNAHQSVGQSCGSITRLFLHESIHDQVMEKLVPRLARLRIGDPLDPATDVGPLISKEQYDKVMGYIDIGKRDGARCVLGGRKPAGPAFENGFFVEPTIFDAVTMKMRIANEEIFGPVLSVLTWSDRERMIDEANAVSYGLTAAVFTTNLKNALEVADRIDSGYVWINGTSAHFLGAPFGGHKNSGVDLEEGLEELYSYTQSKTINITF